MTGQFDSSARDQAAAAGGPPARSLVDEFLRKRIDRRQFLSRAAMIGLSASTASALLAACGSGTSAPTTSGAPASSTTTTSPKPPTNTLSWRPVADVSNVDPAILSGLEDPTYVQCFFETLITYKPGTTEQVNCLAESFEKSSDGKQFHFTLKQGIPFQKGYGEMQASDVKYSFERIAGLTKPKLNSPYQGDWAALESVQRRQQVLRDDHHEGGLRPYGECDAFRRRRRERNGVVGEGGGEARQGVRHQPGRHRAV